MIFPRWARTMVSISLTSRQSARRMETANSPRLCPSRLKQDKESDNDSATSSDELYAQAVDRRCTRVFAPKELLLSQETLYERRTHPMNAEPTRTKSSGQSPLPPISR